MAVRPFLLSLVAVSVLWSGCAGLSRDESSRITVDGSARHQTITGMGAFIYTFSGPYDLATFPAQFVREMGCSIARIELCPEVLDEEPGDLDAFLSEPLDDTIKRLNLSHDLIQRAGVLMKPMVGNRLDEFRVVASVWSPPKWMKTNNSQKDGGHLRADRREHFAKYMAAFCRGFEQTFGVSIFALSIQNELAFVEPYRSCVYPFDTNDYAETAAAVARSFKRHGISIPFFGPEHMGTEGPGGHFYNENVKYLTQVKNEPEAFDAFKAWAFHGYAADGKTVASAAQGWTHYAKLAKDARKELWMSETSGNRNEWISYEKLRDGTDGRPNGVLPMNLNMHDALVYGDLNAWIYWSVLDFTGRRRGAQPDHSAPPAPITKKMAAARHYFRFIRPGAVRVDALPTTPDLAVCAFVHDTQKTLSIVATNQTDQPQTRTVSLRNLKGVQATKMVAFRTSAEETWLALPEVVPARGKFTLDLPPQSVVTLTSAPRPTAE